MLSLLFAEQFDVMKAIADFYFPIGRVLDCSFGIGSLVQSIRSRVTGLDKDPNSRADVIGDSTAMPFAGESFQAVIFDPPYLFGRQAAKGVGVSQERRRWRGSDNDIKTNNFTPEQFLQLVRGTLSEAKRVVVPGGIVVVKIADSRLKGTLVLNHVTVLQEAQSTGFTVRDLLIYTRFGVGLFKNKRTAQPAHGYFLVFEKP